jgi:5-methylcytosine-specific restriction endonuclease McrA
VKRCPGCGNVLPATIEYFHHRADRRSGLQSRCRECVNAAARRYRQERPEQYKAAIKKWRDANPEKYRDSARAWWKANPEKRARYVQSAKEDGRLAVAQRRWADRNSDKLAAKVQRRRAAGRSQAASRRWRAQNPDRQLAASRRWREENPEKLREAGRRNRARRALAPVVRFTTEELAAKVAYWGDRCWICGTPEWEHIDHVKPVSRQGWHALANLRPICRSCNSRKQDRWPFPTRPAEARRSIGRVIDRLP